jgi:regulator of replication initiation timing
MEQFHQYDAWDILMQLSQQCDQLAQHNLALVDQLEQLTSKVHTLYLVVDNMRKQINTQKESQ